MSARPQRRPTLALLSFVLVSGCVHKVQMPVDAIREPERLAARVREATPALRSMRGEARVEMFSEQGYTPFTEVLAMERPGRLHLEALGPFDVPVAVFTCDGGTFQLYSMRDQVFYRGAATREIMARFTGIPLSPEDLVDAMMGLVDMGGPPLEVGWDQDHGRYLLKTGTPDGPWRVLAVDPATFRIVEARSLDREGGLVWRLEFQDFQGPDRGPTAPMVMIFEAPARELEVSMIWKDREVEVDIPEDAWHQDPPHGARVEELR